MNLPPKDFTPQENIIAKCLDEFGLRYEQQSSFHPYTVDFFIPELWLIIEADGIYGHFSKRDIERDMYLMKQPAINQVLHIKDSTKEKIRGTLWQALTKLETPNQNDREVAVLE